MTTFFFHKGKTGIPVPSAYVAFEPSQFQVEKASLTADGGQVEAPPTFSFKNMIPRPAAWAGKGVFFHFRFVNDVVSSKGGRFVVDIFQAESMIESRGGHDRDLPCVGLVFNTGISDHVPSWQYPGTHLPDEPFVKGD
jgi:hypothetical protein